MANSVPFKTEACLFLQNPGSLPMRNLKVTCFGNDGIEAVLDRQPAVEVPAAGQQVWPIRFTVGRETDLPGTVVFDVAYTLGRGFDPTAVKHLFTTATLQLNRMDKPVDASLEGSPEPISHQRPNSITLLVTNNLDMPVQASAQAEDLPKGLIVPKIVSLDIPPHSVSGRRIVLEANRRVTPGTQPLVLSVDVSWTRNGQVEHRRFALTRPITLGVFFESDLMKALGIPSFLLLPGCLLLLTIQLWLKFGWMGLNNLSNMPDISIATPGFWVLAISASFLVTYTYYLVAGVNCLVSYGLDDIGYLWGGSILLGTLIYGAIGAWYLKWRRETLPTPQATPKNILEILKRKGLDLVQPRVRFKFSGADLEGYLIEEIKDDQKLVWVSPQIQANWISPKGDSDEIDRPYKELNDVFDHSNSTIDALDVLNKSDGKAVLRYNSNGFLPFPYHLKVDSITEFLPPERLLEQS